MSDKLILLRAEAKQSMQAMVDKALLQDAVSGYKRHLFTSGYKGVVASMSMTMAILFFWKIAEFESVKNSFSYGLAKIFTFNNRSVREHYSPEVYEQDMKYRRQESRIFS